MWISVCDLEFVAFSVYSVVIFLCRTLIHELLKKLDSYLWSQRSGSLAPKVKILSGSL